MYDSGLRTDEFDDWYGAKHNLTNQTTLSDEATASYQKESAFDKADATYSYGTYIFNDDMATRYKQIRIVNNFLQHITVTSVLSDDEKNLLSAEARFIRAMQYFGLVKRYGGVPLQTVPMEYSSDPTSLYQARDTEQSVYDFIIDECKKIYMDLPEVRSSEFQISSKQRSCIGFMVSCCIVRWKHCQIFRRLDIDRRGCFKRICPYLGVGSRTLFYGMLHGFVDNIE